MTKSSIKNKPKKKKKLSAEEKLHRRTKREHAKLIKTGFRTAGFVQISSAADKEFTFDGATSDFDDVFVQENIIVLCEYTTSQESNVSDHIKKKKIVYDKIISKSVEFLQFFFEKFPDVNLALGNKFSIHQYRLKICYCSLNTIKQETKSLVPNVVFLDYNIAKYFDALGKTVKLSARYEIFDFLSLSSKDVGDGVLTAANSTQTFPGSILPESHSNFGEGFKVVSFYMDPAALLRRAYVLRKYGWRDGGAVYQRMIVKPKIASVRRYLKDERRVFINNIIVTLPDDTKLIDENGDTINPKDLQDTRPGIIQIPTRFNTVGIIDGQHRVFSYHEGGLYEDDIAKLRVQQNLLITGLVFPKNMADEDKLQFEARLFLEINSNQTNAKSDLKQEINLIINPYSPDSIAKRVANYLNDNHGPLRDEFERFFYEKGKLKTTSVVSFALRPLVSPHSKSSLYRIWPDAEKAKVLNGTSQEKLQEYVRFCGGEINKLFSAVKSNLPAERWTADRKQEQRFLATVNVNGVLGALRRVAGSGNLETFEDYKEKLKGLHTFAFESFKSSQYNRMGEKIYNEYLRSKESVSEEAVP
ncbi:DGQHR domain-containing protein [Rhizobium leguminosarum]|uniref:DGQHR domain-containing protein n=1 Tax=Rhizobium leguminosarum TaxID=384 RepID=UPI0010321029|nr:DGQHR domain-containing protein [Rhizobium leguminosarum]TAU81952.1 DGQHR domain-containing protein [Rhizobium leguminosarum]